MLFILLHSFSFYLSLILFTALPTTPTSPLSLHDALPICQFEFAPVAGELMFRVAAVSGAIDDLVDVFGHRLEARSEEHTSEFQSQSNIVCRLLLEKKKE